VAGRYFGSQPRAKVSMMSMRPPQHGHGRESIGSSAASAGSRSSGIASGFGTFSNARALATLAARLPFESRSLIAAKLVVHPPAPASRSAGYKLGGVLQA